MSSVIIQRVAKTAYCPDDSLIEQWAQRVLQHFSSIAEVTVRLVDVDEMQTLNRDYRHQDKPTNVLSFGVDDELNIGHGVLGDIVICASVIAAEAAEQNKEPDAHWAHMVTHGVLHLLGFDHIDNADAADMEAHEIRFLSELNFANPYSTYTQNIHRKQNV